MKSKTAMYFALPNASRLRSRLDNPPKELTSDLRAKVNEIVIKVCNANNLQIRAELIDYINSRTDLKFKSEAHRNQVMNLASGIFDSVFASSMDALNALIGDTKPSKDDAEGADEPTDETADDTADETASSEEAADTTAQATQSDEEFD